MTEIENAIIKRCSSDLSFLRENRFQEDWVDVWHQNLNLNFAKALYLSARHYFNLQVIKISFEDVDFYAKLSLILDTPVGNSKAQLTIMANNAFTTDCMLMYLSRITIRPDHNILQHPETMSHDFFLQNASTADN